MKVNEIRGKLIDLERELKEAVQSELGNCFSKVFGKNPDVDEVCLQLDVRKLLNSAINGCIEAVLAGATFYESKVGVKACELWLRRDEFDHNLLLVEESTDEGYRVLGSLPLPMLEALLGGDISGWLPPGCRCKAALTVNVGGHYW